MKMVALDMDGTLLRTDKSISARTLHVLDSLRREGVEIAIATARPPRAVTNLLPEQLQPITLICYNGAEIYQAGRLVHRQGIAPDDVSLVLESMGNNGAVSMVAVECEDVFYARGRVDDFFPGLPSCRLDSLCQGTETVTKVLLGLSTATDIQLLREQLPGGCVMSVTDNGTLCQIMHQDVNKVRAISLIAGQSGHTLADVIAFGDDHNDLEMIAECGLGVAMGNAVAEIRQVADLVTLTNDQDGVAHVLEMLLSATDSSPATFLRRWEKMVSSEIQRCFLGQSRD